MVHEVNHQKEYVRILLLLNKAQDKLDYVEKWLEYELKAFDERRLHFMAYKLERDRHDRLLELDKVLDGSEVKGKSD